MEINNLTKEIIFFELDNPIKLKKYKDKLSSYKKGLSRFKGMQSLNVSDFKDDIRLCEDSISFMESVLNQLKQQRKDESKRF